MRSRYWQELTSEDIGGLDPARAVAVLPVAAVEAHGPHLPLATDAIINHAIIEAAMGRLAADVPVLVLPAMTIGTSLEHTDFAGTLSIEATTLLAAWLDVGRSVHRAGARKIVLFNSHGGQKSLLDLAALKLRAELGMLAVRANYFAFGAPSGLFDPSELAHGLHGGDVETSLMLHLRPELVRQEQLRDFEGLPVWLARTYQVLGAERPAGIGWMSQDLHPAGVCGNAARADAARGARLLEHLATRLATLLTEVTELPLSTLR